MWPSRSFRIGPTQATGLSPLRAIPVSFGNARNRAAARATLMTLSSSTGTSRPCVPVSSGRHRRPQDLNLLGNNPSHAEALADLDLAQSSPSGATPTRADTDRSGAARGNGWRRSANTAIASRPSRHIRRQEDASRYARRATPKRPAQRVAPVLGIARRLSASRRTVAGVSSKRPPLPATCNRGSHGPSLTTGCSARSLPKK